MVVGLGPVELESGMSTTSTGLEALSVGKKQSARFFAPFQAITDTAPRLSPARGAPPRGRPTVPPETPCCFRQAELDKAAPRFPASHS